MLIESILSKDKPKQSFVFPKSCLEEGLGILRASLTDGISLTKSLQIYRFSFHFTFQGKEFSLTNQNDVYRRLKVKNNISLSTVLPWWPEKAEREKYPLSAPGHSSGSIFCKLNCRLVRVLFLFITQPMLISPSSWSHSNFPRILRVYRKDSRKKILYSLMLYSSSSSLSRRKGRKLSRTLALGQ